MRNTKMKLTFLLPLLLTNPLAAAAQSNEITLLCDGNKSISTVKGNDRFQDKVEDLSMVVDIDKRQVIGWEIPARITELDSGIVVFEGQTTANVNPYYSVHGSIDRVSGKAQVSTYRDYDKKVNKERDTWSSIIWTLTCRNKQRVF
jgi:hypothetical protein